MNDTNENVIAFEVAGNPKALKRHRTFRNNGITRQVDPSQVDKADFLAIAHANKPKYPLNVPLRLNVNFYFQHPKSHHRTGKFANELKPTAPFYHTGTPDVDNLIKFVQDALNGVFWVDDKLICEVTACKMYDERPRTEIEIREAEIKK